MGASCSGSPCSLLILYLSHSAYIPDYWADIDTERIWLAYDGDVYDSPDPTSRRRFESEEELDMYPMFENDEERPIYNEDGRRIFRRKARSRNGLWNPCGLLADLTKTASLFIGDDYVPFPQEFESEFVDDDDENMEFLAEAVHHTRKRDVVWHAYPQAFTGNLGHWQAAGVIRPLPPLLRDINRDIRRGPAAGSPIEPVSSQCYNSAMHRMRSSARLHIAQTGTVTGLAAGAWASTPVAERDARALFERWNARLPHHKLDLKIANVGPDRFLRLENVLTLYPHRMADRIREDVDALFEECVCPLVQAFVHPTVLAALKNTTVALVPDVRVPIQSAHSHMLTSPTSSILRSTP